MQIIWFRASQESCFFPTGRQLNNIICCFILLLKNLRSSIDQETWYLNTFLYIFSLGIILIMKRMANVH